MLFTRPSFSLGDIGWYRKMIEIEFIVEGVLVYMQGKVYEHPIICTIASYHMYHSILSLITNIY
jgi:hypothetical protein